MNKIFYKIILFISFILSNEAPEWSVIPNQNINEDCHQINNCSGFPIDLNNFLSDPDSDDLSVTAADIENLFVSINQDLILSITPDDNFFTENPLEIQLEASDGILSAYTSFNLTINPVNDEPVINSLVSDLIYDEDCCADTGIELSLDQFNTTDVDNQINDLTLKISEDDIPDDADYTYDGLTIYPTQHYFGDLSIPVIVEDLESQSDIFPCVITINPVNDEPVFETEIGNIVINEDESYNEQWTSLISSGPYENDNIFFNIGFTNNDLISSATLSPTGILDIQPAQDANGQTDFTVRITDDGEGFLFTEQTFTLTINPVNDEPYFSINSEFFVIDEDSEPVDSIFIYAIHPGGGNGIFKEIDDSLWFEISDYDTDLFNVLNQPNINIHLENQGILSFDLENNFNGNTDLVVTLYDDGSSSTPFNDQSSSLKTINVQVNQINDSPKIFSIYEKLYNYQSDQTTFSEDSIFFRYSYQPFFENSELTANQLRFKWQRIDSLDIDIDPRINKDILIDSIYYRLEMFSVDDVIILDTLTYDPNSEIDTISVDIDLSSENYNIDLSGNTEYNWRVVTQNFQNDIYGNDPSIISDNDNFSFKVDLILPELDMHFLNDDIFTEHFDLYMQSNDNLTDFNGFNRPLKLWIYYNSVESQPEILFPDLKDTINNIYYLSHNFIHPGEISLIYQMRDKAANINQDSINVSYGLINHESDFNLSFNQNMINLNLPENAINFTRPCLIKNVEVDNHSSLIQITKPIRIYPEIIDLNVDATLSFNLELIPNQYDVNKCSIYRYESGHWVFNRTILDNNFLSTEISKFGIYTIMYDELNNTLNYPHEYMLIQNHPNPFNPNTKINFFIPKKNNININIYNIKGDKIKNLFNGDIEIGYHSINWDGKNDNGNELPSGVYFLKLNYDNKFITSKLVKMK